MPADVLSRRALNRALLARQHLLERPAGPVLAMVEHLVGLQAQAPFPPYYGLLARLDGFRPEDLAALLISRDVVRIALMRGTIHLVSADDALTLWRDRFAADGYDLLLAGHTHGGQLCLPVYGTLVTNCGIDRERARGLHRYPDGGQAWLHVSAGLGTSPWAPARFACRPEASLLTLVPRDSA